MKAKNIVVGCALTMLLLSAGIAQAETLWSYDFNNLTPGVITVGTDGWTAPAGDWQTLNGYVVDGAGQDGTKAWTIVPSTQADTASRLTIGYRPFSQLTFAQGDTLEQVFQFCLSDTGSSNHLTMGAVFGGQTSQWNSVFGVSGSTFYMRLPTSATGRTAYTGSAVQSNVWYEVDLKMDFLESAYSALCTLSYRTWTGTEWTEWADDPSLTDITWTIPLALRTGGNYVLTGVCEYLGYQADAAGQIPGYVDNYRINPQVPEPGTLALLASGLAGLLCYAWRKRK